MRAMMQPVPVERFGGVDFNDPLEVGWTGATDLKNVIVENDHVRARDGYDTHTTIATSGATDFRLLKTARDGQTVIGGYRDFSTNKAVVYASGGPDTHTIATTIGDCVGYRNTTDEYAYFVTNAGSAYQYVFSTGAFSDVSASLPNGGGLAVTPVSNRLVVLADTSDDTRVHFSGPDTPTTFGANDWVDLPTACGTGVPWANSLLVFGSSEFYAFYGESTDSTGAALFNYRTVQTPTTVIAACAGPDGVYMLCTDGVYATTGGEPTRISKPLDRWFARRPPATWTGRVPTTATFGGTICASSRRLYVGVGNTSSTRCQWVLDFVTGAWTYWELPTFDLTVLRSFTDTDELVFGSHDVTDEAILFRMPEGSDEAVTTDDGAAIASHYTSGRARLANGQTASIRGFDIYGSGSVTLALAADGGALNTGSEGDGKTAPPVTTALVAGMNWSNSDALARDLTYRLSATSGAWQVDSVIAQVDGVRDWT